MIDVGTGAPIVLIPGLQGRWEWMATTIKALSARHRVLSFSLKDGDVGAGASFDAWLPIIDRLLDRAHVATATIVGVSFGGIIAVRYASRRPERVSALVLVSAPSPRWRPDARTARYLRHPRLALPAFAVRACLRAIPEIVAAKPTWPSRIGFGLEYAGRVIRSPLSPTRMAAWVAQWMATDIAADCACIRVPVLLITGEPKLDRVVPVPSTLDYVNFLPQARHVTLHGTGHIGLVSKADEFAQIVSTGTEVFSTVSSSVPKSPETVENTSVPLNADDHAR